MPLFDLPEIKQTKPQTTGPNIKLKKGQTINDLVSIATQLVNEKLGKYRDKSKCVTDIKVLKTFFDNTVDIVAIDTETTGLNYFTDELVGFSVCNGVDSLYIPLNHKSAIYNTKLVGQIPEDEIRTLLLDIKKTRPDIKFVYHNAKFDLAVFRTFLGECMPDPWWDTMLAGHLFDQNSEHSLKYLYNRYIAVEDEGVNRFDALFHGITFDYIPLNIATIYGGKDALMTYELYKYQKEQFDKKEFHKLYEVFRNIEMPLLPILEDMQRTGVNLNQKMLKQQYDKYNAKLQEYENLVYKEIEPYKEQIQTYRVEHYKDKLDDPINIGSPAQLSILFYKIIGYKTKSGKGTGVHELEEINSPLTNALLEYRKALKLIDAFLVALPKRIEPTTGKIHTSLNQYRS